MRISYASPLVVLLLAGCGAKSPLAGKWNASTPGMPPAAKIVMDFSSDTFTQTVDMTGNGLTIHADSKGTYKIDGTKVKMTTTEIKLDDSKLPAAIKDMVKQQVEAEKGKTQEGELKVDGDTATITTDKGAMTLTKIKS